MSMLVVELAKQEHRSKLELAEHRRPTRRLLALRRARRMERKAERRLLEAWCRAAELRARLESVDY